MGKKKNTTLTLQEENQLMAEYERKINDLTGELIKRRGLHWNSAYEGYAHLLEDMQELKKMQTSMQDDLDTLWDSITGWNEDDVTQAFRDFDLVLSCIDIAVFGITENYLELKRLMKNKTKK